MTLVPDSFTPEELEGIRRLEAEKYRDPQWIDLRQLTPDLTGSARVKTPGGLVEVHLTLVGENIKVAYIHGDFFAAEGAVAELERLLRWHSAPRRPSPGRWARTSTGRARCWPESPRSTWPRPSSARLKPPAPERGFRTDAS